MNAWYNQGRQANGQTSYTLHPISNYTFGTKAPKVEKDTSVKERLDRMKHKQAFIIKLKGEIVRA